MMKRLAALLSAVGVLACAAPAPTGSDTLLRVGADGSATVEGRVLENHLGCRRDLACYLRLDRAGEEVRIYYHRGESTPCLDAHAARQASAIAPGARVRAVGRYRYAGGLHLLDVCTAPASVLQVLPPS
jgi:hypothetical protein